MWVWSKKIILKNAFNFQKILDSRAYYFNFRGTWRDICNLPEFDAIYA